jgi:hypothetical protein
MRFHTKDFVRGLLTRVLYTGKIAYYGKGRKRKIESVYPGRHPALISDETFQALTDLRKTVGKHPSKMHGKDARVCPLTGILFAQVVVGQCVELLGNMLALLKARKPNWLLLIGKS